jgi:hypothetical protein
MKAVEQRLRAGWRLGSELIDELQEDASHERPRLAGQADWSCRGERQQKQFVFGRPVVELVETAMSDLMQALLYAQVYGGPVQPRRTVLVFPTETAVPTSRSLELRDASPAGQRCVVDVLPFPLRDALAGTADRRLDELVAAATEPFLEVSIAATNAASIGV